MGTWSITFTRGPIPVIYCSSTSLYKLVSHIQEQHPVISTKRTDSLLLCQMVYALLTKLPMAHAGHIQIRMACLGFLSRLTRQPCHSTPLCRDSWQNSHSMQGRESTLQPVSSASFGCCKMLICWWKESYGGHYGPVFAEYIKAQNARAVTQTMRISLETLTIINGWMNPIIQVGYHDPIEEPTLALNKYQTVRRLLQFHGIRPLPCGVLHYMDSNEAGLSGKHI